MKGSIRERSPGHWAIILDQRDPATGKRKRKWHSFAGTKREAQVECSRLITAMKGGTYQEPNKITLGDFLSRWVDHIQSQVSPKVSRALCRHRQPEPQARARRRRAYQAEARPDFGSLQQGARQRPARRQGRRPVTPHRWATCTAFSSKRSVRPFAGNCSPATLPTPSILRRSIGSRCRPTTCRRPPT